jgi:hypothetical protein
MRPWDDAYAAAALPSILKLEVRQPDGTPATSFDAYAEAAFAVADAMLAARER